MNLDVYPGPARPTGTPPHRLVLSDEQMTVITDAARESWASAVVETFKCFGLDMTDPDGGPVRCSDYAIPVPQWCQIAEAIADEDRHGDPIRATNHMLDWMNHGPSSFEPPRPGDDFERDEREPDDEPSEYYSPAGYGYPATVHAADCQGSCCR